MRRAIVLTLALSGVAFASMATSASASLFCPVMKTTDGYVALRDAPNMQGKLIAKMRPSDEIMLTVDEENGWIKVMFWHGDDRYTKSGGGFLNGWMNSRFLPPDQCG